MEIKSYKMSAVIPVMSYGNIQPSIELEGGTLEESQDFAMTHIKDIFARFADQPLKESDLVSSESVKIVSFNEEGVVVDYKPNPVHEYSYEGKKLVGATSVVSQFTKSFDAKAISKNCEKPWGVKAEAIQEMWKSNGDVSSDFGSAIHKALEHYFNFKTRGEVIQTRTEKEVNPAMPKHPILRGIIEDFEELNSFRGEVLQEVLVTDIKNGRCGQIDRLLIVDKTKKVCRIQDYKVNVGAEEITSSHKLKAPYEKLPANKLSKYQLQMSVYAKILQNSGWTVTGIDAFILDDVWSHVMFDVIDI